jgi:CelD/BcsL family acetyltransferase involved in cellulose biosynthesis
MEVRLVDSEAELDALEPAWNALASRLPAAFFSSFDYVRQAWTSFHQPADRLLVLVLSDHGAVQAIAPLCVVLRSRWGIRHRVVRYIAAWEGDRPGILSAGDEALTWHHVIDFLTRSFRKWDILDLMEQAPEGPAGRGWGFLQRPGMTFEITPDAVDYYISIDRSWDDYLRFVDGKARRNWQYGLRRLAQERGTMVVERVSGVQEMDSGLSRYLAIERAGWKTAAAAGVAKDNRHIAFYQDLLKRLASTGGVRVDVLVSAGVDVAASLSFVHRDVVYGRHTAYHPSFAKFSPGIVLHAEIFRDAFQSGHREIDLLGMPEGDGSPRHKYHWATGKRETVRITGYRKWGRLVLLVTVRSLWRRVRRGMGTPGANAEKPPELS